MKNLLLLTALTFSLNTLAAEPQKVPAKKEAAPVIKPKVKRPCKTGQSEEKDDCHKINIPKK